MSFPVLIQTSKSEKISLTKNLVTIATVDAVLKAETSIINPILLIEGELATYREANYCTIVAFARSYFIQEIISVSNDLLEFHCHVDVLSSFASEIKANKGIVKRQENDWNLYLNDTVIKSYSNPIITTTKFPSGFDSSTFILLLAGNKGQGMQTTGAEVTQITVWDGGGVSGNVGDKTTQGLVTYAYAMIGEPYWYGAYGFVADASILGTMRASYPENYDNANYPAATPFEDQYGHPVHDCSGLIKGFRWSKMSVSGGTVSIVHPTVSDYVLEEDANVAGLYAQCTVNKGILVPSVPTAEYPIGAVCFYEDMSHCGVYVGSGYVIEARGHTFGVQRNLLSDRTSFKYWGIPNWIKWNGAIG